MRFLLTVILIISVWLPSSFAENAKSLCSLLLVKRDYETKRSDKEIPSRSVRDRNTCRNSEVYRTYLKGLFYIRKGNYREGLKALEQAKRLDPQSVYIRLKISSLYLNLGDLQRAEKELTEAKKIDPENIEVSVALIFLYSYTQKNDLFEKEYEFFLEKSHTVKPEDVNIANYLAQFYFYKKRYDAALKIYEVLVKNNPDFIEGYFWIGYLYEETGRRADAIAAWKKALQKDPEHAAVLNSLGYVYAEEGICLDEAEAMIKKALEKEPESGAYLDSLGWIYFKKKQYLQAEEYLKKSIAQDKDPIIYEHLGDLYVVINNIEEALKYYKEGFSFFPDAKKLLDKIKQYEKTDSIPQKNSK